MKKISLFTTSLAVMTTLLAGCNKEGDSYQSVSFGTLCYVTTPGEDPIISESTLSFNFNYSSGLSTVSSSDIEFKDGKDSFAVSSIPFEYAGSYYTGSLADGGKTKNGTEITNFKYTVAPMYLPPRESWNLSYNDTPGSGLPSPDLSMNIPNLGVCMNATFDGLTRLRTFWNDVTFVGKTSTSVNGNAATAFENNEIYYRVKMNIRTKKADVIMYNVQFNPHMPAMTLLILSGLDVVFTNQGYIVEGQNMIPLYISGNVLVEKRDYPFSSFILTSTADLAGATISFTVTPEGRNFLGAFQGDCMVRLN